MPIAHIRELYRAMPDPLSLTVDWTVAGPRLYRALCGLTRNPTVRLGDQFFDPNTGDGKVWAAALIEAEKVLEDLEEPPPPMAA